MSTSLIIRLGDMEWERHDDWSSPPKTTRQNKSQSSTDLGVVINVIQCDNQPAITLPWVHRMLPTWVFVGLE